MSEERGDYNVAGRTEVRRESRLPFADPQYAAPTQDEFREVARMVGSGSEVAAVVGVDKRRVREYIGGQKDIPYALWRLLLLEAGLALGHDGERQRYATDENA
jgi:hypothetical protein